MSKLLILLFACLLLVTLFDPTSACGRRRRHRFRYRSWNYGTTTERYYGKRSVDNVEDNEVGIDDYESSRTNCGKTFCPKVVNYPTDEIIDAVDRLHQHLHVDDSNRQDFANKGMSYDHFYTSDRSKTLARRPHDHWYSSDVSGCKQHVTVHFPQEAYSSFDSQSYYVVNVPNLRQSLVEYTCMKSDQTCPKDKAVNAYSTRMCQQNYGQKQFVVLPMNKRHFEIDDFEVKTFIVPESCGCSSPKYNEVLDNQI